MTYKPDPIVPPFLTKTFELVSNPETDHIIKWSEDGSAFLVVDEGGMLELLSLHFKHNKMASFVRQLNVYGFHKMKTTDGSLKFGCECFQRGQPDLLRQLRRKDAIRKENAAAAAMGVVSDDLEAAVDELKEARDEDLFAIDELRKGQEAMKTTVDMVLKQNRLLRDEMEVSRKTAVEMQRTLKIIMGILEMQQPAKMPSSPDSNSRLLAMLLDDEDLDLLSQPPAKRFKPTLSVSVSRGSSPASHPKSPVGSPLASALASAAACGDYSFLAQGLFAS